MERLKINPDCLIYVTDQDIEKAFKGTNFGHKHPRRTIADTLLKIASQYGSGRTAIMCCVELGLIKLAKNGKATLTKKGGCYLYDQFVAVLD